MDTLDGVGHGTALAGRYRLEERLQHSETSGFWRAVDQTLDRAIGVRVLVGPAAEETLDAARRASMIDDPRLLRVLDVGTQDGPDGAPLTYVVSEFVDGISLAELLRGSGPLPADQVRELIGEAARGLEHARTSGLHHRRLGPGALLRTPDGAVKVAGLAVDAAAEGVPDVPSATAARDDAVALVAMLYAGLTGRWPFGEADGLLAAPVVGGRAAPPADVVGGVPNDLDTLCAVTLGPNDDGPRTPGELADQLAPWGPRTSGAAGHAATAAGAAGERGGESAADDDTRVMRPAGRFPVKMTPAAGAAAAAASAAAKSTPPSATQAMPAVPASSGQAGTPAQETSPATNTTPPRETRPTRQPDPSGSPAATAPAEGHRGWEHSLGATSVAADGGVDDSDASQRRDQSKIVLALVAVLVVIGLVLAVNALSDIGDGGQGAAPTESEAPGEPASPPAEEVPPAEEQPPAGAAPTVVGVRTVDPAGDGENDETAPRAIDDDPASFWNSSTYDTADFGNLKDGLGLLVALNGPSQVGGVTISVNGSGGTVELRNAPNQGFEGSEVLASSPVTGEPIDLALEAPVEAQYLLLWWTELPETDSGFRIELSQVQVR